MANEVKIEGYENAVKILSQYPDQFQKIVKKSMRTAVQPTLKTIKAGTPHSTFKRIVKMAFIKAEIPTLLFGSMGKKGDRGNKRSDFMKAYWSEFGTIQNRDKTHKFHRPMTSTRKGGIIPRLYFAKAIEGQEKIIYTNFVKAIEAEATKLYNDGKS
jgi:hypothetical protein